MPTSPAQPAVADPALPGELRRMAPKALALARELRDEWIELCLEMVRLESPSEDPASQGPVLDLLARRLAAVGLDSRRWTGPRGGGGILARPAARRRGAPWQLLLGHCDTVWSHGTLERMPARRDGDLLRGPGVYDMKGGLAQMVFAFELIRCLGVEPTVTPLVLVNSDEEIGSHDSRDHIRRLAKICQRVWVLEPGLGPEGLLKTARKGVGHFVVRVRGKAAHAGLEPEKGVSAILELSHVIQRLFELNDPRRGVTVNVGTVDGGLRTNVVAAESIAEVDVRVPSLDDVEEIETAIHSLQPTVPGVKLEIEGAVGRPPMEPTARNLRLWRLADERGRAMGLELGHATAGGGSDGNFTSLHAATLDGLGVVGRGAHADHEQVDVERSVERIALLALLILAPPVGTP